MDDAWVQRLVDKIDLQEQSKALEKIFYDMFDRAEKAVGDMEIFVAVVKDDIRMITGKSCDALVDLMYHRWKDKGNA